MRFRHEVVALSPEVERKLDTATIAMHYAVHDAGREIGRGLVLVALAVIIAAGVIASAASED